MSRTQVVTLMSIVSALAAIATLIFFLQLPGPPLPKAPPAAGRDLARMLIGLWVLAPPLWFWIEWVVWSPSLGAHESERVQHLHDLARNIWIAFVAVLVALYTGTIPGVGQE